MLCNEKIYGEIYIITNKINNKKYIGQTLSHRKNKNIYKKFGYIGRFKDHISEAKCNTKKNQCWYLNNAIRHYNANSFWVELLLICEKEYMNQYESKFISYYNTLYPNGYNLTRGGKTLVSVIIKDKSALNAASKRGGCTYRSNKTSKIISEKLKLKYQDINLKKNMMKRSQDQHDNKKYKNFRDCVLEHTDLERYIRYINGKNGKYIRVTLDGRKVSFHGKHETIDEIKKRALIFLNKIKYDNIATLPNCSGKP
jgi:hypothetical protein